MKYFHLNGIIDEELFDKFIQFINENESERWTIVLNSGGGKQNLSQVILDVINIRKEYVTLISTGIYSSSFVIFYFAKCQKKMTIGSIGMIHLRSNDIRMQSHGKPEYTEGICVMSNWKVSREVDSFVEAFLTKSELKEYRRGNDVYFNFKRMKEIFPDAEII
jgi:hypothetical protein